jgi:Tfp pilus assembly protein PilN
MINLLPPDIKSQIVYARKNARLVRFVIVGIIGLLGVALVTAGGTIIIANAEKNLSSTLDANNTNLPAIESTEAQVNDLSDKIKAISAVLSREVKFSDILRYMGGTLPSGTILTNLSLSEKLAGTLNIDVASNNYDSVAVFRQNLEDFGKTHPDKLLFSKADINNVTCNDPSKPAPSQGTSDGGIDQSIYPCLWKLTATFAPTPSTTGDTP